MCCLRKTAHRYVRDFAVVQVLLMKVPTHSDESILKIFGIFFVNFGGIQQKRYSSFVHPLAI